jgi:hypothetical protein
VNALLCFCFDMLFLVKEIRRGTKSMLNLLFQEHMELLDEGKAIFRLRSRLCSSLYPVNEKIREFFAEYDRYALHTSQPLGSELLEVCFSGYSGSNFGFAIWDLDQNCSFIPIFAVKNIFLILQIYLIETISP